MVELQHAARGLDSRGAAWWSARSRCATSAWCATGCKNIVLRADVGITEEAWEVREEQLTRVRNLQLERRRSEQQLNEELREVLDDRGDTEKPAGNQPGSQK